ncbi:MAG TPA: toll/interleukin-1 receptor domain-containing protein, partial [Thermoanaerobaculia bacterium]
MPPLRIFLSYSHTDEAWKDRVSRHLAVLTEEGLLDVWDDRRIGAGADWEAEIRAAMDAADVAILLISADLLTSRFVRDSEVPRLLQRRVKEGVRVIPLLVHPCLWKQVPWLAALQIRPWNGKALASLRSDHVDEALVAIAEEILKPPAGHSEGELREPEGSGGRTGAAHVDKPSLLDWARQKPAEAIVAASALITAFGVGLGILGLVTERTREGLIG